MPYYKFANIVFKIKQDYKLHNDKLNSFLIRNSGYFDISVTMNGSNFIAEPTGNIKINEPINDGIRLLLACEEGNDLSFFLEREISNTILCRLDVDRAWENASIKYLNSEPLFEYYALGVLGNLLIRNKIIFFNGLVIHSSAIIHNNRGIIFTAPSGTGKSTHSVLWEKYYNARVINDDCPPIRFFNGMPYVFGTPWSGSTDKFCNESAPLSAIVILEQSKTNSIRKIKPEKCATLLIPRCYMPYYDSRMMNTAMNTLEEIIKAVPIYILKCRPDKEAADLVYQAVVNNWYEGQSNI